MKVSLVSYSQPPGPVEQTLQDLVAYCARVSNPEKNPENQDNEKLIGYLIRNKHWSPLEMVSVCLEIETTRDIARQILRHRSFSFQEFSQRYAIPSLDFEPREARLQDSKNRQNSLETDDNSLKYQWLLKQTIISEAAEEAYNWAIEKGIAREQARVVLPEGMTPSRMYVNGTLRSWIHYIELRSGNGTQKEHREVALECAKVIGSIFPPVKQT